MDAERMQFVELWAEYVKTHSDQEWSKQQNVLINAQFPSRMTREHFLAIKKTRALV